MSVHKGFDQLEIVLQGGRKCLLGKTSAENPLSLGIVRGILSRLHLKFDPHRQMGATESFGDAVDALADYQIRIKVVMHESLEEIALLLEEGHTPILAVNAGGLWSDSRFYDFGATNHLVLPIQCYRNARTSQIEGFAAFQTSAPEVQFLPAESLSAGWLEHGGVALDAVAPEFFENVQ